MICIELFLFCFVSFFGDIYSFFSPFNFIHFNEFFSFYFKKKIFSFFIWFIWSIFSLGPVDDDQSMNGSIITRKFLSFFLGYGRGLCWIVDEWWTLVVVVEYLCMVCVCDGHWFWLYFFPNLVSWGGDVFFASFSILLKAFFFSIRLIIYGCNFQPSIWFFSLVWPLSIQFNSIHQTTNHFLIGRLRKNEKMSYATTTKAIQVKQFFKNVIFFLRKNATKKLTIELKWSFCISSFKHCFSKVELFLLSQVQLSLGNGNEILGWFDFYSKNCNF